MLLEFLKGLYPIHIGKPHVQKNNVRCKLFSETDTALRALCLHDIPGACDKMVSKSESDGFFIIYDKNAWHMRSYECARFVMTFPAAGDSELPLHETELFSYLICSCVTLCAFRAFSFL